MNNSIKLTLAAARVNANLTQEEAAKLCGVSRSTIINWESGKTRIKKHQAIGLANIYGIPIDNIFLPEEFPNS